MKYFVVAILSILVIPFVGSAQTPRVRQSSPTDEPPVVQQILAKGTISTDKVIDGILSVGEPDLPLGPADVLREYENEMIRVANRLSAELASISQAKRDNRIRSDEAEYLIAERYRVAMMQHEVLSALHENLENDLAQTPAAAPAVGVLNIDRKVYTPVGRRP